MKWILTAAFALLPLSSFASLDQKEVLKEVAGQYRIEAKHGSVLFVIHSNGEVQVVGGKNFDNAEGRLTFNYSRNESGLEGLPVADVVIGLGSDEDVSDYHALLTVEQGETPVVRLAAKFVTFNDGPNGISSLEDVSFKVLRYNKGSKNFEELK